MVSVLAHVLINLSFERRHQHAPGALAHQRIQVEFERILLRGLSHPGGIEFSRGIS